MAEHKLGEVPGFTRRYQLNRLVWFEHFQDIEEAIAKEKRLKGWLRSKKNALIEKNNPRWFDLSADWGQQPRIDRGWATSKKWSVILRSLRMTIQKMNNPTNLSPNEIEQITGQLREANQAFMRRYPGESNRRQAVHTVYGGAHLFKADSAQKLGAVALRSLDEYAPDAGALAEAL